MKHLGLIFILSVVTALLVNCAPEPKKDESLLEEAEEKKYSYLQEAYKKQQHKQEQNVVINEDDYPYATVIPGKQGYVLSPYSQKPLDVRNQQSGDLVLDPYYARSEKKYFRIP